MLFSNWADPGRVIVIGPLAYLALVVLLRASGKRTLTKLNVSGFLVTIALGSTLAPVILTKSVSLAAAAQWPLPGRCAQGPARDPGGGRHGRGAGNRRHPDRHLQGQVGTGALAFRGVSAA